MNHKTGYKILLLVISTTILCGFLYLEVQQILRQSANDPQIQIANSLALSLRRGLQPKFEEIPIDIAQSLSPYVIIFNAEKEPISGNGQLEGTLPNLPQGVFEHAKILGENRVTWQPRKNIRSALVIVSAGEKGYVLVGRSLRETEKREAQSLRLAILAWLALNMLGLTHLYVSNKLRL